MLVNQGVQPVRISRWPREILFPTALHAQSNRSDRSRELMEAAARTAIELHAGRALTDAEWAAARARLLEFAGILRDWDRKTTASRRGNVEVLCQPEP